MKKLLGIVVLGLLFVSIDLSNPTRVEAGWFDSINPVKYFEQRKICQEIADRMDTVAEGKRRYKNCMEDKEER